MRYALIIFALVGMLVLAGCQSTTDPVDTDDAVPQGGDVAVDIADKPVTGVDPAAENLDVTVGDDDFDTLDVTFDEAEFDY